MTGQIRWGRIVAFLMLTFGLSWGFHLLVTITVGQRATDELALSPLDMLFPAAVALFLRLFILEDSPIHRGRSLGEPRLILFGFLLLAGLYTVITLLALWTPGPSALFQALGQGLMTAWTLLVFHVAGRSTREQLERAGLQLGDTDRGAKLAVGVVVFMALQAGLNLLPGLGRFPGFAERVYGIAVPQGLYPIALIIAFGLAVTGIPLSGLAAVFGEEYGWRGFLQDELAPLGGRRGAMLVGIVWGVWHLPVILSGVHTYPPTFLGAALGLLFFVLWGFVQSYAMLWTGSIWAAAFLHGLVDSLYAFTLRYLAYPESKVLSFGLGVYGLACLGVVVSLLLRHSIWDESSA